MGHGEVELNPELRRAAQWGRAAGYSARVPDALLSAVDCRKSGLGQPVALRALKGVAWGGEVQKKGVERTCAKPLALCVFARADGG